MPTIGTAHGSNQTRNKESNFPFVCDVIFMQSSIPWHLVTIIFTVRPPELTNSSLFCLSAETCAV